MELVLVDPVSQLPCSDYVLFQLGLVSAAIALPD